MKQRFNKDNGCEYADESKRILSVSCDQLHQSYETTKSIVRNTSGDCYTELQSILIDFQNLEKKLNYFRDRIDV